MDTHHCMTADGSTNPGQGGYSGHAPHPRNPSGGYGGHAHHPSGGSGNQSSPFSEALDTFHAEFITQPIEYPLGGVSPPPPIPLVGSTASSSTGSPAAAAGAAQMPHPPPACSPSQLPSFLDTYSINRHLQEMSPQPTTLEPRFTFKHEPPSTPTSSTTPTSPFTSSSTSSSHIYSHETGGGVQQQVYPGGPPQPPYPLKKEFPSQSGPPGGASSMTEFYQPPSSTPFAVGQPSFSGGGGPSSMYNPVGGGLDTPTGPPSSSSASGLPPALQGALQGALQEPNILGTVRAVARRTYVNPRTSSASTR